MLVLGFVLGFVLAPAMLAGAAEGPARVPLHWLWHAQQTDSSYTVSAARRAALVRDSGYVDMGPIAFVDARPVSHALPLICYYSPAPRTNTFCSISVNEQRLIRELGYKETSSEGFVHDERVEGSVVLYRLSRAYGDGKDREHRFVTTGVELIRLRKLGWTYDGSKGFVYPLP